MRRAPRPSLAGCRGCAAHELIRGLPAHFTLIFCSMALLNIHVLPSGMSAFFRQAIVFSGHMIDVPGRCTPRFPRENVHAVADLFRSQLRAWGGGRETLAVCSGAAGGDIVFAESACEIGASVHLLLPFDVETFVAESVEPFGDEWVRRFHDLRNHCTVLQQGDLPGSQPERSHPFERNNRWVLEHARAGRPGGPIFALLLWDTLGGDGNGGTADFAHKCAELAVETVIIRPTTLQISKRRAAAG